MRAGFHDDITATAAPHLERNNGSASQLPPPPGENQTPPKTAGNFTLAPLRGAQQRSGRRRGTRASSVLILKG